jgi:deazaflavin-dependent oxidoreductase (nitroreductase family)
MWRHVVLLLGGIVLAVVALSIVFLVGMRAKYPPVTDAVRKFNRNVTKSRTMETAGQPGAYAGLIRHVGRSSGTEYETPIGPFETDEGFIVPLPYGTKSDWLKNVQQAGAATIVFEGQTYHVDEPEVIVAEDAMAAIPPKQQRSLRWFKVNDFLRVQAIESQDT